MKSSLLLAMAAVAAIGTTAARADTEEAAQRVAPFQSSRTRAEVQAEAVKHAATFAGLPAGPRTQAPAQSTMDTAKVRLQAAEALRQGRIPRGEAG